MVEFMEKEEIIREIINGIVDFKIIFFIICLFRKI